MAKNLDAELAEVAGIDDDGPVDPAMAVPQPAAASPDGPRRGSWGLLATLLAMVAGIVVLFIFGFKEASIYSMPLADFLANSEQHADRRVRIEGELVPGSLTKREKPCEFRFTLRDIVNKEAKTLQVRFPQCIVPDTFRDMPEGGVLVTAEGSLEPEGHFEATEIMAKCSSKYNPETHELEAGPKSQAQVPAP